MDQPLADSNRTTTPPKHKYLRWPTFFDLIALRLVVFAAPAVVVASLSFEKIL